MPTHIAPGGFVTDDSVGASISRRIDELRELNDDGWRDRARVRDIMNGGASAVARLLGEEMDPDMGLPIANMMLSAGTRLAQKLGRAPDVKIDVPVTKDTDRARLHAERRTRIVSHYDDVSKIRMMLPQVGRWLPGYGFTPFVLVQRRARNGEPFPGVQLRDPFETFLGEWGEDQQPIDMAVMRTMSRRRAQRMFPSVASRLEAAAPSGGRAIVLGSQGGRWSHQGDKDTVEVWEYHNTEGRWMVIPEITSVLGFVRNPLQRRPAFYVAKRFAFDRLSGQYDQIIGLMSSMARLGLLTLIAAEDSVMSETNITGDLMGEDYRRGRDAVNFLTPGSQIVKRNDQIPQQVFQQADRFERQLRLVAGYPLTDDAISPNSFVTGRGLDELTSAVDREVQEYFTVLTDAITELDSMRLEWDERLYPNMVRHIEGEAKGDAYAETYRPSAHISGQWRTRRVYGAMAGFDEPTKIITGLQLLQADIIDTDTLREQVDGLENHSKIRERILAEKAERVAMDTLMGLASQGDPRAMAAAIGLLPQGEMRRLLEEVFQTPEEVAEEEAAQAPPGMGEAPPDVTTVLSRLTTGQSGQANPLQGVQTVGRV